ncbi:MAG: DUF4260 domain-containing protein [Microscillaceae bacterium]|nr:DUF4260 domain-containing protein [Microscillaceae bacterium]
MKTILKIEELAMFVLAWLSFEQQSWASWWFWVLLLTPDVGMLGYVWNSRVGAFTYNIFHHKGIAIGLGWAGWVMASETMLIVGIILFAHSAFDRVLGYGLKYGQGFKYTHLGEIGHKGN